MRFGGRLLEYSVVYVFVETIVLIAASTTLACAEDIQAKLSYCKDCHGVMAQAIAGTFQFLGLPGSRPNIWKINYVLLSSTGEQIISCST